MAFSFHDYAPTPFVSLCSPVPHTFLTCSLASLRRRSGSIDGVSPTSLGPNLIAALSTSGGDAAAPVGTWKLIKGKVSQTIEDIKSSKNSSSASNRGESLPAASSHCEGGAGESDTEGRTNVTEDLPGDTAHTSHFGGHHRDDSDSDVANEIALECDAERSRLKRGIANLKSKVKSKSSAVVHHHHNPPVLSSTASSSSSSHHHQQPSPSSSHSTAALSTATISTAFGTAAIKPMKKSTSPNRSGGGGGGGGVGNAPLSASSSSTSSSSTSLRNTFLRKRRKQTVEPGELATPTTAAVAAKSSGDLSDAVSTSTAGSARTGAKRSGIVAGKKDIEIESGVEMLEDMIPHDTSDHASGGGAGATAAGASTATGGSARRKRAGMELPLQSMSSDQFADIDDHSPEDDELSRRPTAEWTSMKSSDSSQPDEVSLKEQTKSALKRLPWLLMCVLIAILLMPVHDFIRGIVACLLGIAVMESMWRIIQMVIEAFLCTTPPEKTTFEIPEYTKMSICEIPAVEEHKTVKSYSGWMNEVNSYDPNNFHISMSKSVYVKLEGTILRMSTTTARIPKRVMWNEAPIDRSTLVFVDHRTYNLLGCRIELLPLGLAKKRYFNRKYPIQLIIKNCVELRSDSFAEAPSKRPSTASSTRDEVNETFTAEIKLDIASRAASSTTMYSAQSSSNTEMLDERSERLEGGGGTASNAGDSDMDFAATILSADLQSLQDPAKREAELKEITVPCGDEVRLLLFSRGDREKEDWFRRFTAASTGEVFDQDLRLPNVRLVNEGDLQTAAAKAAVLLTDPKASMPAPSSGTIAGEESKTPTSDVPTKSESKGEQVRRNRISPSAEQDKEKERTDMDKERRDTLFQDVEYNDEDEPSVAQDDAFEGLLISTCAARNPVDYIRFMSLYQQKRAKRQEDELWRGIDQSLFLGPSGSVVWANVLIGRFLYRVVTDTVIQKKIQEFLQKKLSTIKLPSYMEDVVITQINVGNTPPLIHRISQPMLDERGTWFDLDVTYEGHCDITVTTKLNLLRLKRQSRPMESVSGVVLTNAPPIHVIPDDTGGSSSSGSQFFGAADEPVMADAISGSAIYDSDAESSGGSSSEPESPTGAPGEAANVNEFNVFHTSPGNARRIFRIVDRFTASNFFQYATELSYVQRAMENMSANVTLRVELKGLVGRATINLPPPPSDRIWLSFRGPPRLWISAKPAVGDKSFDWSIVTNVIESKLCEEVNKYFVYPNMVDVTVPFLGSPTYTE